jgi:hypothetical protein
MTVDAPVTDADFHRAFYIFACPEQGCTPRVRKP